MSVRDYLNKGVHIADTTVAAGAVPEAAPTLVAHGYPVVQAQGSGPNIVLPFVAVWADIVGGAAPTATLRAWGYVKPPAAGATLTADWQLITESVVADSSPLIPTLTIIPVIGIDRFAITVNALTGGPTSVRLRYVGISASAAQALIAMGAVSGASADVNLAAVNGVATGLTATGYQGIAGSDGGTPTAVSVDSGGVVDTDINKVGGNAVASAGLNGVLPVGGTVADDAADDASHPVKIGAVVDAVISAVVDGRRVEIITDQYRRVHVRPASYDELSGSIIATIANQDSDKKSAFPIVNVTNYTDGTYYYYMSMDGFRHLSCMYLLHGGTAGAGPSGVTLTVEATWQNDSTVDTACTYIDVSTTILGAASVNAPPNTANNNAFSDNIRFLAGAKYVRFKIVAATNGPNTGDWALHVSQVA